MVGIKVREVVRWILNRLSFAHVESAFESAISQPDFEIERS